jgi:hypothetical protein
MGGGETRVGQSGAQQGRAAAIACSGQRAAGGVGVAGGHREYDE